MRRASGRRVLRDEASRDHRSGLRSACAQERYHGVHARSAPNNIPVIRDDGPQFAKQGNLSSLRPADRVRAERGRNRATPRGGRQRGRDPVPAETHRGGAAPRLRGACRTASSVSALAFRAVLRVHPVPLAGVFYLSALAARLSFPASRVLSRPAPRRASARFRPRCPRSA